MFGGGPCPPLYIRGDRVTWKVLVEYSWSPTRTQSGSFLCTAASSMPIRVVPKEIRYIHELSLTLEHSMTISSPAVPSLTLSANDTIPSAAELKNRKYCKWHNAVSYSTCECRVFCKEIQSAIEAGRIKFDVLEKPMKIDGHPFPVHMVEAKDPNAKIWPRY